MQLQVRKPSPNTIYVTLFLCVLIYMVVNMIALDREMKLQKSAAQPAPTATMNGAPSTSIAAAANTTDAGTANVQQVTPSPTATR